jgi:hypothetical protein
MSGGVITNDGVKVIMDNAFISSPTYTKFDRIKIGIGTTAAAISDTDLEESVPISGQETVDDCEAITGWNHADAGEQTVLDNSTFKEGSGALRLPKDNSSVDANWSKSTTSLVGTSKELGLWLYIKDATALAKLTTSDCVVIRFGSDSSNYYEWTKDASDFAVLWNWIGNLSIASPDSTTGSPVIGSLDYSYIALETNNATDTFVDDDIIMDFWQLIEAGDYTKSFDAEPTIDETNKIVKIRSRINSNEGNGFQITEYGAFNGDSSANILGRDVFTAFTKSATEELVFQETITFNNNP